MKIVFTKYDFFIITVAGYVSLALNIIGTLLEYLILHISSLLIGKNGRIACFMLIFFYFSKLF